MIGDRFAVVGGTIPVLSDELGDYGVFWNPDLEEGFAWANVDYTGEFANARRPQGGAIPTVSEWSLIVMTMLAFAVGRFCLPGDGQTGRLRSYWDHRV